MGCAEPCGAVDLRGPADTSAGGERGPARLSSSQRSSMPDRAWRHHPVAGKRFICFAPPFSSSCPPPDRLADRDGPVLHDGERFPATSTHDRRLGQHRGNDPDVTPTPADRLGTHAPAGGGVPRGRPTKSPARFGPRGVRQMCSQGPTQSADRGGITPPRLRPHHNQGKTTTWMRVGRMFEPQLVGNSEESAVVVPPSSGGISYTSGRGEPVGRLVQQALETQLGSTGGGGLVDQALRRREIGQVRVVTLDLRPGHCQFSRKNWWCRAHIHTNERGRR